MSLTMSVDARQELVSEAEIRAATPPSAMICEEARATITEGSAILGTTMPDFTERYALLSDPSNSCTHPDVRAAARYAPGNGSCYIMRAIGSGVNDMPMSCIERHDGDPADGAPVASLRCSGWGVRLNAMMDGGFSTHKSRFSPGLTRSSHGACRRF
ncbi:MAG: hypothetical protein AAF675_02655 [Pseudomonadota bacterium]